MTIVMVVGVEIGDVVDHRCLLRSGLRVFFAQVPIQCQVVPEPGNQLAAIKFSLRTKISAIKTCPAHCPAR